MRGFFRFSLLLIVAFANQAAFSQAINIGRPLSTHFTKDAYKGGTQSWDFDQDKRGRLFVANNNGLLIYDGREWEILPLPNFTILRSVKIGVDNKVFVGGQGILGFFQEQNTGQWEFRSLNTYINEAERNFGDVWEIALLGEKVFFRTTDKVFQYDGKEIKTIHQDVTTYCICAIDGELLLHNRSMGLLKLTGSSFEPVGNTPVLSGTEVTSIISLQRGALLIITFNKGLFLWENEQLTSFECEFPEFFRQSNPLAATRLSNNEIAIGTAEAGLVIMQSDGIIRYQLDKQQGLQNGMVRSLFSDQAGNLWAGLENGIDLIHTRSPFSYVYPDGDLESPAYAIKIKDNKLYAGMASGLFQSELKDTYAPFSKKEFSKITKSEGQVWGLYTIDNQLLMGHHTGPFKVQNNSLTPLGALEGVWNFNRLKNNPGALLAGHYLGISMYDSQNQKWKNLGDFNESSRFVEIDQAGRIWISHPYRGIYMFDQFPDSSTQPVLYGKPHGLPSNNFNHLFNIHGELVVVGERGVFSYDGDADSFTPHKTYAQLFDNDERVIRLVEAPGGNVWFVTDKSTGVIEVIDEGISRKLEKRIFPEIQGKLVAGFEHIYPFDEHNVFFAATKGLIHLDPSREVPPDSNWTVWIKTIQSLPKEVHYPIQGESEQEYSNKVKSLRFSCAASMFEEPEKLQFRYRLQGLDDSWSSWGTTAQKEYNNLSFGSYVFDYQAKSAAGIIQFGKPFSFYIAPPWYASNTAFAIYSILGLAALAALVYVPQRAYKKEKEYLQTLHKRKEATHLRELEQTEQALANLEKERLQDEVRHKTSELASTTMHLVQKNQLLIKLKTELEHLTKKTENPEVRPELKKLVRLLESDIRLDDDWEQFSHHFDQVHSEFVSRLIEKYPQLTPNDHRLCAYLRMNLSSKEIAPLMNISVRGVEVSRYRLRKKLELPSEVNLTEFMMRF